MQTSLALTFPLTILQHQQLYAWIPEANVKPYLWEPWIGSKSQRVNESLPQDIFWAASAVTFFSFFFFFPSEKCLHRCRLDTLDFWNLFGRTNSQTVSFLQQTNKHVRNVEVYKNVTNACTIAAAPLRHALPQAYWVSPGWALEW